MNEDREAPPRRSFGARAGIVLLNLLAPGAGLIRTGHWRAGLGFAAGMSVWLLALTAAAAMLPMVTPTGFIVVIVLSLVFVIILLIVPTVASWRASRFRPAAVPPWGRWYALLSLFILCQLASIQAVRGLHGFYRPFYAPAEAMHPTILTGERFVADMRGDRAPRIGEIILLNVGDAIYVKRVAALDGDRIAMRDGVPIVNGVPAAQREVGTIIVYEDSEPSPSKIIAERLPGQSGEHRILDMGVTDFEDQAEVTVPPGHLFVLGDNRDRSADSRVPRDMHGVEMLPMGDVVGRPLFKTWTADWQWLGTPLD
ncbi:MAG TPA: signal peptidase I [Allosphingosinicella sp.]